jgi:hypothetical protein
LIPLITGQAPVGLNKSLTFPIPIHALANISICAQGAKARAWRSTGTRDRAQAKIIAEAWAAAEEAVATGHGTKDRITEILNETLKRVGIETIARINIGD